MRRHGGHTESGTCVEIDRLGQCHRLRRWHDHVFRRGAEGPATIGFVHPDPFADSGFGNTWTHLVDDAGAVLPRYDAGEFHLHVSAESAAGLRVRRVHARYFDTHANLSYVRNWIRHLSHNQHVTCRAFPFEPDGFHGVTSMRRKLYMITAKSTQA